MLSGLSSTIRILATVTAPAGKNHANSAPANAGRHARGMPRSRKCGWSDACALRAPPHAWLEIADRTGLQDRSVRAEAPRLFPRLAVRCSQQDPGRRVYASSWCATSRTPRGSATATTSSAKRRVHLAERVENRLPYRYNAGLFPGVSRRPQPPQRGGRMRSVIISARLLTRAPVFAGGHRPGRDRRLRRLAGRLAGVPRVVGYSPSRAEGVAALAGLGHHRAGGDSRQGGPGRGAGGAGGPARPDPRSYRPLGPISRARGDPDRRLQRQGAGHGPGGGGGARRAVRGRAPAGRHPRVRIHRRPARPAPGLRGLRVREPGTPRGTAPLAR